jgi:putative ABC transport system permease protein
MGQPMLAGVKTTQGSGVGYFHDVERAARSFRGITWVEWADRPPGVHPSLRSFRIEPPHLPLREVTLETGRITAASLDRFRLPPVAGRLFGFEDRGRPVAVVNEAAAAVLFGGETAGRTIEDMARQRVEIVGVVVERRSGAPPTIYYGADGPGPPTLRASYRAQIAMRLVRAELDANVVSAGYFQALGFSLLKGEYGGAMVNSEANNLYFGGNAIGAAVIDDRGSRHEIVGIVAPAVLGTFQRREDPAIYLSMAQNWVPRMTMIVGAARSDDRMAAELQRKIESVPGAGAAPAVKTLESHLSQTALAPLRIATLLMAACAAAALLLAALGLYGAMSDAARQRRRESAVRIALGARRRHVIGEALREGGRLAASGVVTGAGVSVALWRWLAGIAPDVGAPDLWVWLSAPAVLAAAVAAASALSARGALMADPVKLLREE